MSQQQNTTLEQAVAELLDSEASLQKFIESADQLTTASRTVQDASQALDTAQQAVSGHAAAAGDLATELARTAGQLADTAAAVRAIDPAAITKHLEEQRSVLAEHRDLFTAHSERLAGIELQLVKQGKELIWILALLGIVLVVSAFAALR